MLDVALEPFVRRAVRRRIRVRDLVTSLPVARVVASRDVKLRYKQSALGPVWLVVQPLGMLAGVAVAFAGVTKVDTGGVPYFVFALVGLAVWSYFQQSFTTAAMSLVTNQMLVRRSPCPRLALVIASLLSPLPVLGVLLTGSLVGALATGHASWRLALFPLLLLWLALFVLGPALIVAAVSARYRDMLALMPLLTQAGVFVSPVGYSLRGTSGVLAVVLSLNPISGLIEAWRWGVLGIDPVGSAVAISLGVTVVLCLVGWATFARFEPGFADYV